MFKAIKEFFFGKPATQPEAAPYKVEAAPVALVVEGAGQVEVPATKAESKPKKSGAKKPAKTGNKPRKPKAQTKATPKKAPKQPKAS